MKVDEFIKNIVNCPELKEDSTQDVLVRVEDTEYQVKDLWLRGDNTIIIETATEVPND